MKEGKQREEVRKQRQEDIPCLLGFPHSISIDSLHKLLEEVSKAIINLDIPTKSASSASSATPEPSLEQLQGALTKLEAYFSVSVDAALLEEATLLRFKQASELLVHKRGFLGEVKCYLLRHYLSQLDDLVQSLHISVQKNQETFSLMEKQKKLIYTRDQYKSELNTCSDRMSEMVLKYQQMKQDLRDLEVGMISHRAHLHRLFSQKNSISQELSELPKIEELLQNQTQEAARFRQRAEDGWKGLSSVFNDGFILF